MPFGSSEDEARFFRTFLEEYNRTWSPGPTSRFHIDVPGAFYLKSDRLFAFDLFPPTEGFKGWDAYAEELTSIVKRSSEFSLIFDPEHFRYARNGDAAWMSATFRATGVATDGFAYETEARQTVVLEKQGNRWLVAHEHISVPYVPSDAEPKRPPLLNALQGLWSSEEIENRNGARLTRTFRFIDDRWSLDIARFTSGDVPIFMATYEGQLRLGGPSGHVAGASKADFLIDTIRLTRLTANDDAFVATGLGLSIDLTVGQTIDVSETGYGWIRPVSEIDRDLDIIKLDADKLQFGERPADGSGMANEEMRPKTLNPVAVYRR